MRLPFQRLGFRGADPAVHGQSSHGNRMMVTFARPSDLNDSGSVRLDQKAERIRVGLCGALANATRITGIAAPAQDGIRDNDGNESASLRCALTAV